MKLNKIKLDFTGLREDVNLLLFKYSNFTLEQMKVANQILKQMEEQLKHAKVIINV